ncbi:MAG: hypothetical protein Q9209_004392 [Squamulea sp. 1 TL-2023]
MTFSSFISTTRHIINEIFEPQDFSLSTWMTFGAILLLLSQAYLPSNVSNALPLLYLAYRVIKMVFDSLRLHTGSYTTLKRGRWSAALPEPENPEEVNSGMDGVVMFVLGARINQSVAIFHRCKLSPGAFQMDDVFQKMWQEAEKNRIKWGYLGRTATLVDHSDSERPPTIWLSYWKGLKGLQEFSASAAHRLGQNNYHANKYPYMGIMHETFYSPKGCWETIYGDFPAWGFGNAQTVVEEGSDGGVKLAGTLQPNITGSTMFRRMGREKLGSMKT